MKSARWIATPLPEVQPRLAQQRNEALVEGLGDEGWFVDLLVHHGAAPVGSDSGVMWIEEDRLFFAGERTSFGLTPDQVGDFCHLDTAIPGLKNCLELRLSHETPAGTLGITFSPISTSGRLVPSMNLLILGVVNRWIGRGRQKDGQLPPLTVSPDAEPISYLFFRTAASLTFWASIPLLLLGVWSRSPVAAVVFAIVGLTVGTVWTTVSSPLLRIRAWKDRRKLEVHRTSRLPPQSGALT